MEYFQKFLDGHFILPFLCISSISVFTRFHPCILIELEQAPPYLQQEFKIIRDLDEQVQNITSEAATKTNELLRVAKSISKDERVKRLSEIQNLYQIAEELSNDKVSRAESIYELVDRQIQRLDADMMEFKKASVVKTMKKSRKKALSVANVKMPASAAFVLALTNDPKNITDMPIDPNEPTYCICGDVSYGEMVACDNKNCPIEWFHFGCVGLTSKPKGAWYCSQCSEANCIISDGATTLNHQS
ncbi:unnamed protein product [Rodentolepis nana]|uniref:Inhibitor of growth protein n=1 Tax=Rodentolepis nana TaxID=102285 RepID=A0A0R3T6S2_RODNA|nr:unnamed protein product [Rodentolepis nana]